MNGLSVPGQAQKVNDQIVTFGAWVAIFASRYMNNLSAAGQAQKEGMARSFHFELGPFVQVFTF